MPGFGVFQSSNFGRIDQGVDFAGAGPIPALDKGVVTDVGTAHLIEGGTYPYVVYTLKGGPHKGQHVYVAENFTPEVHTGQHVKKGQEIGAAKGTYPYIEVGFNQTAKGWDAYGNPSDRNSPEGTLMWDYIHALIGQSPKVTRGSGPSSALPATAGPGAPSDSGAGAANDASLTSFLGSPFGNVESLAIRALIGGVGIALIVIMLILLSKAVTGRNLVAAGVGFAAGKQEEKRKQTARKVTAQRQTERHTAAVTHAKARTETEQERKKTQAAKTTDINSKRRLRNKQAAMGVGPTTRTKVVHQHYLDDRPKQRKTSDPATNELRLG